jgi:UDP:flavonoid glycosyltransferase YjiC (YdhE family)
LQETCEDLSSLLQSADFLINATLIFPGPMLARKFNIPWASVTLQPFCYFSKSDPVVLPFAPWLENATTWGPVFWLLMNAAMHWGSSWWLKNFHQLRENLAVADYGHPLFEGQYSPDLNFALFSPHFAQPQPDWPSHTVATGFPFMEAQSDSLEDLPEALRRFLEAGRPPIVFTLGSSAVRIADDFYNTAVRAMKQLNTGKREAYRAIFLIGNNTLTEPLTDAMLAWDYVPYGQLFPHVACIVHQGGIGTTAQVMRAGKPMLIVPYGFDQPDNAARAQRLGVSVTLRKSKLNDKELAQTLEEVLTQAHYGEKAKELSLKIQSENCFDLACQHIEAVLN